MVKKKEVKKKKKRNLKDRRAKATPILKANSGWTIRKKELNNKSRKGEYVYIKHGKKRASYYKIKDIPLESNIDYYVSLYQGNIGKGVKGKSDRQKQLRQQITSEDILKKAKVQKRAIDKIIGKGIWSTQISSAFNKSPQEIKETYKELLFKAILSRDKQTLDLLIQDENIQKLKNRFEFKINILDSNGKNLVYLEKLGGKDIQEVIADMKKFFGRGKDISGYEPSGIKEAGYNYQHK